MEAGERNQLISDQLASGLCNLQNCLRAAGVTQEKTSGHPHLSTGGKVHPGREQAQQRLGVMPRQRVPWGAVEDTVS